MGSDAPLPVLVVKHVPWEGPHRIADVLGEHFALTEVCVLDGDTLPPVESVAAAVLMGGPMNVDETDHYPGLLAEREWLAEALERDLPLLGICLGAQLIARALGAQVRPGRAPELGWLPIEVHATHNPLLGALAPTTTVLHWHGDVFDLPHRAELLASSGQTECQAFRHGNAIGVLFHPEADAALVDGWLAEPAMAAEAEQVLGAEYAQRLRAGAEQHGGDLTVRSRYAFEAFAALVGAPV